MNAWGLSARQWRKEAKHLRRLLRRADEFVHELNQRQQLIWADGKIIKEFGIAEFERYSQMSPPEMFRRLLEAERKTNE